MSAAEIKLQEMLDRGWHLKMSRQKSLGTWDLTGALNGWLFSQDQTYCTYGTYTSLFEALVHMEQMLLNAEKE